MIPYCNRLKKYLTLGRAMSFIKILLSLDQAVVADSKGILYIGKADNLYNRVASLQKSVLKNCNNNDKVKIGGHQSLSKKVYRIQRFLDVSKMTIKIVVLPTYESILYSESYLLEDYVNQFGELPPLNGQYGNYEFHDAKQYLEMHNINFEM